jgi:hypothetical protein
MINEIIDYDGFDLAPSTDDMSDSQKKLYKKLVVVMGCLKALTRERRIDFLINYQLKQKSNTDVLDGLFIYVCVNTDIDMSMEKCETMMENNEISEGCYIRTCDTLKVMHDALSQYNAFKQRTASIRG